VPAPVENIPITLDYLKGKRRAEKALGFIIDLGSRLLGCGTTGQVAQETAEHLIRLNLDLAMISYRPLDKDPLLITALAPDLASVVPETTDVVAYCRQRALELQKAEQPGTADTAFDAGGSRVVMRQFGFDYQNAGSGFVSVARIRATAPDFTSAELALLRHVTTHFVSCVRCLPC
jgi:hypothetical protein